MAVAKTYAHMKVEGEPFKENGRMYVNVIAPKGIKKVRWYSDAEYRRMYPESGRRRTDPAGTGSCRGEYVAENPQKPCRAGLEFRCRQSGPEDPGFLSLAIGDFRRSSR